jgi:HTH-type transcriptional regulator, transcriptional repressor of NAD biosynthesis genes
MLKKKGLIIGKFHPLHIGHIGLINFGLAHCDTLIVLVCASNKEKISGILRQKWLQETFKNEPKMDIRVLDYDEAELPNTSVSSEAVSKVWADKFIALGLQIDILFSSEKYGDFVAKYMNCKHIPYEMGRETHNIAASQILENPLKYWDFIAPEARSFFVKKICICGTESTGKSTLTVLLAKHFSTNFVPEMAREIIEHTESVTEADLNQIATLHAQTILEKTPFANKFLFVDTDLLTTKSYAHFLFNKPLIVEDWIEKANVFDAYIYLQKDAIYVQDGTRLALEKRNELDDFHQNELKKSGVEYEVIGGNWGERFDRAVAFVEATFGVIYQAPPQY